MPNCIDRRDDYGPCSPNSPLNKSEQIKSMNEHSNGEWIYAETVGEINAILNRRQYLQNEELKVAREYVATCKKYNGYMLSDVMATYIKKADTYVKFPTEYKHGNIQPAIYRQPCTQRYRWKPCWKSTRHRTYQSVNNVPVGYKQRLNVNYISERKARIEEMNTAIADIRERSIDYCSNQTTLLTATGMETCGMNQKLAEARSNIQSAYNASNKSFKSIKDTDDYPQYSITQPVYQKITNIYNYDPMKSTQKVYDASTGTENGIDASITSMSQQNKYITENANYANDNYNNCANPNTTLLSVDDNNIPNCLQSKYVSATNMCNKAINMSKKYNYKPGTTALTGLWDDVNMSIPGNIMSTTNTVLANSQDSCKKWVDMFNVWEEKERVAMNTPCFPERPIESSNDKTIIKITENWHDSNGKLIDSLIKRLKIIETYIQNYPNILELKPENIQFAPSSLGATAEIKQKRQNKAGVCPTYEINMIIPNGKPGAMGEQGYDGIKGESGYAGSQGNMGSPGNPTLPM